MVWTPTFDMSSIPPDVLVEEIRRRFMSQDSQAGNGLGSHPGRTAGRGSNAARQAMVRSLSLGRRRSQPVAILRFLVARSKPQTMTEIIKHMRKRGSSGRSYYDHLNALMDVHLAEQTNVDGHKAWIATSEGKEFVNA